MIDITLKANGYWLTYPTGKRFGPFARVEQVAEGSIYYRIYKRKEDNYFLLFNASNGRIRKCGEEREFERIGSYSQKNKSFVAYACRDNGCQLVGENTGRKNTGGSCLYASDEFHNYRAIKEFSGDWRFVHSRTLKPLWDNDRSFYFDEGEGLDRYLGEHFFTEYLLDDNGRKRYKLFRLAAGEYSKCSTWFAEIYEQDCFLIGVEGGRYHVFSTKRKKCNPMIVSDTKPEMVQQYFLAHDSDGYALLCDDKCYTNSLWQTADLTVIDKYVVSKATDGMRLFTLSGNRVSSIALPIGWTIEGVDDQKISVRKADGSLLAALPRELEVRCIDFWNIYTDRLVKQLSGRADTAKPAAAAVTSRTAPLDREAILGKWKGMIQMFPPKIHFYTITPHIRLVPGKDFNIDAGSKADGLNRGDYICWIAMEERLLVIVEYCELDAYEVRYYRELTDENIKGLEERPKPVRMPEFHYTEASLFTELKRTVFRNLTHKESEAYRDSIFRERLAAFVAEQLKGTECQLSLKVDCTQNGDVKITIQESEARPPRQRKAAPTTLRITFPDNTVISGNVAATVLEELVRRVGVDDVAAMPMGTNRPFMGKEPREKAGEQRELPGGWYLYTKSSTTDKAEQARRISEYFNLQLKVEIVSRG